MAWKTKTRMSPQDPPECVVDTEMLFDGEDVDRYLDDMVENAREQFALDHDDEHAPEEQVGEDDGDEQPEDDEYLEDDEDDEGEDDQEPDDQDDELDRRFQLALRVLGGAR